MSMRQTNVMRWRAVSMCIAIAGLALCQPIAVRAEVRNPNTDWFRDAGYGVFMHFLPGDAQGLARVKDFDVDALADQVTTMGAKYFVLTLGQNSGFMNSPNSTYERITGYAPGQRCSTRDLPLDLYRALATRGIRLMLYLPCQVPNRDVRAQEAFGLPQGPKDQPITIEFAKKWAQVIQEWSDRYGDKVAGWWFDGGYEHIGFNEAIAQVYAAAVKHGNPKAIVTFNPGVSLIRWTQAEDYTAGELNEPFDFVPTDRWVDGSQWHALTYLGSRWGARDTRYSDEQWAAWMKSVLAKGGVVTLDMGPNYDPQAGPIGSFAAEQVAQVQAIGARLDAISAKEFPPRLKRVTAERGVALYMHYSGVWDSEAIRKYLRYSIGEGKGSPDVDVSVNRLDGKLTIHLVNTSGAHWDRDNPLFDSIAPVGPLQVIIRGPDKPARVTLEPGAESIPFEHRAGEIRLTVPSLEIHRAIAVQ